MRDYWPQFLPALADTDQPKAIFGALARIVADAVGTKLFTVLTYDRKAGFSTRVYSDDETAYPTGGHKKMRQTRFSQIVMEEQKPFSALTIEEIAEVFLDHELIRSLGCESCCNIPLVIEGEVIGTLNLLDEKGYYTPERVEKAMQLRPYAAVALLLSRLHPTEATR